MLIRRARRVADYLQAGCVALHVASGEAKDAIDETVKRHMSFARNLRIETQIVKAENVSAAITEFARKGACDPDLHGPFFAAAMVEAVRGNVVQQVVRQARDMQITIVAERRR